ncbi:MAG TPA: DNA polymerase, partial [Candidatus Paceibacterota bacterium]|nr:DNA polymerase [Candidatus Paceibacterota bacterium]
LIDAEIDEQEARLLLQVHDELVYEVRDECIDKTVKTVKGIMESVLPQSETHGVPIIAEAKAGPNWGTLSPL